MQEIESAICQTQISFIVVSTPSEPDGGFSLRYVEPVCQAIGRALAKKDEYHVVCLTSTVMPGTTGGPVRDILEKSSGKRAGQDFGLCYSPEFIALGSVIRDFLNPDMLLIGESDTRAGDVLQALYKQVCENRPAVARMSFVNAEITKLSVNSYVTTKISFANMLARISEKLLGANVDVVTAALGLDTRIGAKYLKGAVSYGGPCFPRDNLALAALARKLGVPPDMAQTVDSFNRSQTHWLAALVKHQAKGRVGILGLTYKPGTDVIEEAVGFLLAKELVETRRGYSRLRSGIDPPPHQRDGCDPFRRQRYAVHRGSRPGRTGHALAGIHRDFHGTVVASLVAPHGRRLLARAAASAPTARH